MSHNIITIKSHRIAAKHDNLAPPARGTAAQSENGIAAALLPFEKDCVSYSSAGLRPFCTTSQPSKYHSFFLCVCVFDTIRHQVARCATGFAGFFENEGSVSGMSGNTGSSADRNLSLRGNPLLLHAIVIGATTSGANATLGPVGGCTDPVVAVLIAVTIPLPLLLLNVPALRTSPEFARRIED